MVEDLVAKSSLTIHASVSKVWEALVNPEMIKQYMYGSDVVSDWEEGSKVIYKGNYKGKEFEDKGNVVKIEPDKYLIMTHWSPLSGTPDAPENYHRVTYELIPDKDSTQLIIIQNNNSNEEERQQNEQFWMNVLEGLKKIVEK